MRSPGLHRVRRPRYEPADVGPYVIDNFNDDDYTNLSAHTPDRDQVGGRWTQHSVDAIEIQSNKAEGDNANVNKFYSIDTPIADNVKVTAVLETNGVSQRRCGLLINITDETTHEGRGELRSTGILYLFDSVALRASGSVAGFAVDTPYAATLERRGATIDWTVDGNLVQWTGASASPTVTRHGLLLKRRGATVDAFVITDK